jgi:pimeloyl-ACP methyl ester carboxylesterase
MKTTLAFMALGALAIIMRHSVQEGATVASSQVVENDDPPPPRKGDQMEKKSVGEYASINGLKLYYEVHQPAGVATDAAVPLILLHGGIGFTAMFDPLLPVLSKGRKVIAIDMQGHGRTADIDRPLRYELLADDIAALIKQLKIEKIDIMGYSLGGGVALRFAIQHPDAVRKLVVISAAVKRTAWYPEVLEGMKQLGPETAEAMKPSPLYKTYSKIAPNPKDWPTLMVKLGDLLNREYDWTKEVAALKMPTLIVAGDADSIRPVHIVEFFELRGGGKKDAGWDGAGKPTSQLAILPGATHYDILDAPTLPTVVAAFLDSAIPAK